MTAAPHDPLAPQDAISPAEAATQAAAGWVELLDVREDDEWDAGHAADARHIPLGELDPAAVDRDRQVVTVCRSGKRSSAAADRLRASGLLVRNLTGGMQAWEAAGLPVVRGDGSPGTVA